MKKATLILVVVVLMLSLFVACGNGGEPAPPPADNGDEASTPAPPEPPANVRISLAASASWLRDIDRELAERFTAETGIEVDLQAIPDDQYESVLMARLATGEGPDIFMGETGLALMRFQPERFALPLCNEPWVDQMPEFMFDQASVNGVIYAFTTWGRDFRAMIFNTALFERYDIAVPTSYATFVEASETLLANGITPVFFPGAEEWYNSMSFDGAINIESQQPGSFERLNNNEMTFSESEGALTYLQNLQDSAERGIFGPNFLSYTHDQAAPALASEEYAMWFGWSTQVNDIEAAGGPSADTFLAFPAPWADDFGHLSMTGAGMTRMINRDSNYIEAAKLFFEFLARPENLQDYYDGRIDLLESTLYGATASAPRNFGYALELVNHRTIPSPPQSILFMDADANFGINVQSMLFGLMTPEQVLESLDAARARVFAELD